MDNETERSGLRAESAKVAGMSLLATVVLAASEPAAVSASRKRSVAVTFDDLPATALGPVGRCNADKLGEVTDKLLEQLAAQDIPVLGLVTDRTSLCSAW